MDKHVYGVLPLHLALLTKKITVVPLNVPKKLKNKELSLSQIEKFAGSPKTFQIQEIETEYIL